MLDRTLIGQYAQREIEARSSVKAFAESSHVSRATLYRVFGADPTISIRTLRQIERALSLPFDTFASLGAHDFDVLAEMGIDEGAIKWLKRQTTGSAKTASQT